MNPTESIEYFSTLQQKAHDDFAKRFEDVSKRIIDDLRGTKSYHEDYQKVIGWIFELYKVNSTTFYSLFKNVMYGQTDLSTLEGLEEMRSFVGNFFDDSFVKLVVDKNQTYPSSDGPKSLPSNPLLEWHLKWTQDEKCLSVQELIDIMQQVYQADYEWCKQFSNHFGHDKNTNLNKYNRSLLKSP
jgi:hypothetical protein